MSLKNPASELPAGSATLDTGQLQPSFSPIAEEKILLHDVTMRDISGKLKNGIGNQKDYA
jgi:hypothetical protein